MSKEVQKGLTDTLKSIDGAINGVRNIQEMLGEGSGRVEPYGDEQREKMLEASLPLIKYLNENHHPHVTVNVTATSCVMVEGCMSNSNILDYVED